MSRLQSARGAILGAQQAGDSRARPVRQPAQSVQPGWSQSGYKPRRKHLAQPGSVWHQGGCVSQSSNSAAVPPRLSGTLRSWNDERGYGFIAPSHGGAEVFVHISALPRDGTRPAPGERLSYQLGRGKDGKPQALKVLRAALAGQSDIQRAAGRAPASGLRRAAGWPRMLVVSLLTAGAGLAFVKFQQMEAGPARPAQSAEPAGDSSPAATLPTPQNFHCDGRTHCSQMSSCAEATYFLQHCPGPAMDGDGDGVPCEMQWCSSR